MSKCERVLSLQKQNKKLIGDSIAKRYFYLCEQEVVISFPYALYFPVCFFSFTQKEKVFCCCCSS